MIWIERETTKKERIGNDIGVVDLIFLVKKVQKIQRKIHIDKNTKNWKYVRQKEKWKRFMNRCHSKKYKTERKETL